jgi:hypothetical protein
LSRIDLHAHTFHSDGTESPAELARLAAEAGVSLLAVTDHDTTAGVEEARLAGKACGVEVVLGCEISTRIPTGSLHVLAYDFDPAATDLQEFLRRIRSARHARNQAILGRLAALGIRLEYEDVKRHATGEIVARPHFVAALLERGAVASPEEAYERWIGDAAPAYVMAEVPPPEEAVAAVRAAGGSSSVAHPRQLRLDRDGELEALLASLVEAGLDGIEVEHPSHKPWDRDRFAGLARRFGLVPTGGSDFHGRIKPHVRVGVGDGTIDVRREVWERLLARKRARE